MFTKLNLIGYAVMAALIGWLWFQNHGDDATIAELTTAKVGLEAKVQHYEDLKTLKDDITSIFGSYAKTHEENSKVFIDNQLKLIQLGTELTSDVNDYGKDPITSAYTIDSVWVHTYNRSTIRLQ